MSALEEALGFFRSFVEAEFETLRLNYTERDRKKVRKAERRAMEFSIRIGEHRIGSIAIPRYLVYVPVADNVNVTEAFWADAERRVSEIVPRTVFAAIHTEHPRRGELFSFLSGSAASPTHGHHAARREEAFRIVAMEVRCSTCRSGRTLEGKVCFDCKGIGWTLQRGSEKIRPLGSVLDRKILIEVAGDECAGIVERFGS